MADTTSSRRPRSVRLAVALATSAVLVAGVGGLGAPASADPTVAGAQAQADALAKQVAALQVQVEVATETYDGIEEQLGDVVTRYLTASQQVGTLTSTADALRLAKIQRVRALYMAGGQVGLYAQVLDGTDINDVLSRLAAVTHVLDADSHAIAVGDARLAQASADAAALDVLAARRTVLQGQAQAAQATVQGLLQQRQGQLASANALVRLLVLQAEQRAAAAAAAASAAVLGTAATPPVTLPPGTPATVVAAVAAARSKLGDPYLWGATGPGAFDCSGLTQWAYAQAGLTLPRTSREQWFTGPHPGLDQLQPGDLLFWATDLTDPASIHHVALYIGDGYIIEAPHTGAYVQVSPVDLTGYFGATRPIGSGA
jgi:peptidoglycan DL-endopeptidase CwlO